MNEERDFNFTPFTNIRHLLIYFSLIGKKQLQTIKISQRSRVKKNKFMVSRLNKSYKLAKRKAQAKKKLN